MCEVRWVVRLDQIQTSHTLTGIPIRNKVIRELVPILLRVMRVTQVKLMIQGIYFYCVKTLDDVHVILIFKESRCCIEHLGDQS